MSIHGGGMGTWVFGRRFETVAVAVVLVAVSMATGVGPARAVGLGDLIGVVYYEAEFDDGNVDPSTQGPADGMQGLDDVVLTPDGKHLYASGSLDDAIARFGREASTGLLTFLGKTADAPLGPHLDFGQHLAVSPDSKHLYATGRRSSDFKGAVSVFTRVEATGDLTFTQALLDDESGVMGLGGATAASVSPDGRQVYVVSSADNAIAVFDRDTTTGLLTFSQVLFDGVAGVDGLDGVDGVIASPDGKHVYTVAGKSLPNVALGDDAIAAFTRDDDPISPTFGELTFVQALFDGIGGVNGLHEVHNVDISSDGRHLYTAAETDAAIGTDPSDDWLAVFSRDAATGMLTFVEAHNSVDRPECGISFLGGIDADVEVAANDVFVYVTDPRENTLVEFVRNPASGALTQEKATCRGAKRDGTDLENELLGGMFSPTALAVDPLGNDVYVGSFSPAAVNVFGTPSSIEVGKDAVPDDPQDFAFEISFVDPATGNPVTIPLPPIDDDADPTNPFNPLPVGPFEPGDYDVVERPVSGWKLDAIDCTDPSGGTSVDPPNRTADIGLGFGETVSCTFTNSPVPTATVVIVKDALPDHPQDFEFVGLPGALDTFQLDDDPAGALPNSRTFAGLPAGSYEVAERSTPSWVLSSIACNDPDGGTTVDIGIGAQKATIDLDPGEIVTCTFTNTMQDGGLPPPVPTPGPGPRPDLFGFYDQSRGLWHLPKNATEDTSFHYGNPRDQGFVGDWDCNGTDTVGVYRDGRVYLRNSNSAGVADIVYTLGNPGDVALAGDFDADGCDTVSLYRPSRTEFHVFNGLADGTPAAVYAFGNPGDAPFAGDFDGNGTDTFGLHRRGTGQAYLRNSHGTGIADVLFTFGDPGDVMTSGDWDGDGDSTPGVLRRAVGLQGGFLRNSNTTGVADATTSRVLGGLHFPLSGVFFAP